MPTHNVLSILKESEALIKRARAQQKSAQDIDLVGGNPSTIPGAEYDTTIPAGSETPSPEVADGTMGSARARTTEGAGDDSPITRGHTMDSETAAPVTVNEVPMVTDEADADPKTAALCNDLLGSIRSYQRKAAANCAAKPAAKPAVKPVVAAKKAQTDAANTQPPQPEREQHAIPSGEGGTGGDGSATGDGSDKEAFDLELTQSVLQKIAAIALSYEEGVEFVSNILEKHAGRQAAESVIGLLVQQDQAAQKQASSKPAKRKYTPEEEKNFYLNVQSMFDKLTKPPQTKTRALLSKYGPAAGGAAVGGLVGGVAGGAMANRKPKPKKDDEKKEASALIQARAELDMLYKMGQDMADAATADIMGVLPDADAAGAEMAGGADMGAVPEDMGAAEVPAEDLSQEVAEDGTGEEEATIEDVAAALDILVSEGTIAPEEAEAVLQDLISGNDTDTGAEEPVADEGDEAGTEEPTEA